MSKLIGSDSSDDDILYSLNSDMSDTDVSYTDSSEVDNDGASDELNDSC